MKIGYLVYDLNDPAVLRRLAMFQAAGADVRLTGFRRRALSPALAPFNPVELAVTRDAALVQRAAAVARNCVFSARARAAVAGCDLLIARNLEMLAIARRIAHGRPVVYECLDLHRTLLGTAPHHRLLQKLDAALVAGVRMLITSSPAFVRNYFAHQPRFTAPVRLIENKLLRLDGPLPEQVLPPAGPPWVIGWFGMLRCKRTLAELQALVRRMDGRVEVLIAGKPSPAEFDDFEGAVAATPHMRFVGAYRAEDLPALYGQCHFAWTIDWFEEGLNSSWLLPTRLYEASALGVVPIALEGVEAGRWLSDAGAGLVVADSASLADRLTALDSAEYTGLRAQVAAIPRDRLITDRAECEAIGADLRGLLA